MDIRKLQRAIVDGLEDVKGQRIEVYNTEQQSPLFERVIIASGTSNRQTKALAASVRDAVKSKGFDVVSVEGEENGEWIIVDCGAAVVHLMQPGIRDYYNLEEIWGAKPVKLKMDAMPRGLVKASEAADEDSKPASKAAAAKKVPAKKVAAKKVAAKKVAAKTTEALESAGRRKPAAKKAAKVSNAAGVESVLKVGAPKNAAKQKAPAKKAATQKAALKKSVAIGDVTQDLAPTQRVTAGKPAGKTAATRASAKKAPARKVPAQKALAKKAPSKTASKA